MEGAIFYQGRIEAHIMEGRFLSYHLKAHIMVRRRFYHREKRAHIMEGAIFYQGRYRSQLLERFFEMSFGKDRGLKFREG
jgi:hypothetical protein